MGKSGNADISLPCLMPKTIKTTVEKKPIKIMVGNVFVLTFPSAGSPFSFIYVLCLCYWN